MIKDFNRSRNKAIVHISQLMLVFLIASSIANYVHERHLFVGVYAIAFVITSIHLYFYLKNRHHDKAARNLVIILFTMFFSFFFIGQHESFDILWVLILPIVTVILGDYTQTKKWLVSFNLFIFTAILLQYFYPELIAYNSFALWSMLWAGIFLSGMSLYYKRIQEQMLSEIAQYQKGLEGRIIHANSEIETLHLKQKQSDYLLMQSRLSSLETQLNPHFLFNALNSIAELIHINSYKAEEAILKVSSFLRNTMEEKAMIPLSKELDHVNAYLSLENIRFNNAIDLSVSRQLPPWDVPKFSIQLLVENAIKHGWNDTAGHLHISIDFNQSDKSILVCNNGKPIHKESFGIGLNNLNQRLRLLCDGEVCVHSTAPACYQILLGEPC